MKGHFTLASANRLTKYLTAALVLQTISFSSVAFGELSAKERLAALNKKKAQSCADLISKAVEVDLNMKVAIMEHQAATVDRVIKELLGKVEKMDPSELTPAAQHEMMNRTLEQIGGNLEMEMLATDVSSFNASNAGVKEIQGKFDAIMKSLGVAIKEAQGMGASKLSQTLSKGMKWLRGKEDVDLNTLLSETKDEITAMIQSGSEVAELHYRDVIKMRGLANERLQKAELLAEVDKQLAEIEEGLRQGQAEAGINVTNVADPAEIVRQVRDQIVTIQEIHLKVASDMMDLADQGHEVSKLLARSQMIAQTATIIQFPKIAGSMSNQLAVESAKRLLDVANALQNTVDTLQKGIAKNFDKVVKGSIAAEKKLMTAGQNNSTQRQMAKSTAELNKHEASLAAIKRKNIQEMMAGVAAKKGKLQKHDAAARANKVASDLMKSAEMDSVMGVLSELQTGSMDPNRLEAAMGKLNLDKILAENQRVLDEEKARVAASVQEQQQTQTQVQE